MGNNFADVAAMGPTEIRELAQTPFGREAIMDAFDIGSAALEGRLGPGITGPQATELIGLLKRLRMFGGPF